MEIFLSIMLIVLMISITLNIVCLVKILKLDDAYESMLPKFLEDFESFKHDMRFTKSSWNECDIRLRGINANILEMKCNLNEASFKVGVVDDKIEKLTTDTFRTLMAFKQTLDPEKSPIRPNNWNSVKQAFMPPKGMNE